MTRDPWRRNLAAKLSGIPVDLLTEWLDRDLAAYERLKNHPGPFRSTYRRMIEAIKLELTGRGVDVSGLSPAVRRKPRSRPTIRARPPTNAKQRIMYIECKTQRNDRGGARIGRVAFSKSGRTIYYRGLVLRSLRGSGVSGNYEDANSHLEYWVSGPKKNGKDRHWAGGGAVAIDADVVDEYWREIRKCEPPTNPFFT
jgi:hypothetical protein